MRVRREFDDPIQRRRDWVQTVVVVTVWTCAFLFLLAWLLMGGGL